jgi:hypothetical protein
MNEDTWDASREARHEFGSCAFLTPEEKIAMVRRAKELCESVTEEEWRELLRQHEQGLLVSVDEKWIDEICGDAS